MRITKLGLVINKYIDEKFGLRITAGSSRKPVGIEDEAWHAISISKGRSMATQLQKYTMWQSVKYVHENSIEGAVMEFGVWRGGMSLIARKAMEQFKADRDQYLFDTFEGMTSPNSFDKEINSNKEALILLNKTRKRQKTNGDYDIWCKASLLDVQAGMESLNSDVTSVRYIKGDVLDTVPKQLPEKIAICRIDTDWYESTAHILNHCWPRIVDGGILILDDYDYWSGARKAVDEFFEREGIKPFLLRPDSGRIVIKYKVDH